MARSYGSSGPGATTARCAATLFVLFLPLQAMAASPQAPAPGTNPPIQIHADSGIEWEQTAHLYIARGNAVATRGPGEVHADTLIAHYRDVKSGGNAGDKSEIYRIDAEGHVVLLRNGDTVIGDNAVYDLDRAVAVVTGTHLKLTTPTDIVTARDSLEWYDNKDIAVARGNAVAVRKDRTVKADILTAYTRKAASGNTAPLREKSGPTSASAKSPVPDPEASKISRIDAQGHVVVSNSVETGRGDFGVYNEDTGIATLIGNVVIERGKDVIAGQRGVMDLNRNIARMLPSRGSGHRVQGLFVRDEQHGGVRGTRGPAKAPTGAVPARPAPAGAR